MTIFLVERNGDVSIHASPEAAGGSIESPEIVDGEYLRAYDEMGNVFSISVPPGSEKDPMNISLGILTPTSEKDPAGLYEVLRRRFADEHSGAPLSLDELILQAMAAEEVRKLEAGRRIKKIEFGCLTFLVLIAAALYLVHHLS